MDRQVPLSMGFSREEYWSGFPFPTPGDLPDVGIETESLKSPKLARGSLLLAPPGKPDLVNSGGKLRGQIRGPSIFAT